MLIVNELSKVYRSSLMLRSCTHHAVKNVSFQVANNEILGLVGESGCGKTTVGKMIVRLTDPSSGTIRLDDMDISSLKGRSLRKQWPRLQMIFQDPRTSLNPRMRVGESLIEGLKLSADKSDLTQKSKELARQVGVRKEILNRYPHEVSGGEIQRIVIARALSLSPAVLVADEPTSNLDMSVQAQILHLLKNVQQRLNIPCILISHDIEVIRWMCKRVVIMQNGTVLEAGLVENIIKNPEHAYTRQLVQTNNVSF